MLTDLLTAIVGARHVSADPDVLAVRCVDHTGRYRGKASALVRPGSADEVAAVLAACRDAGCASRHKSPSIPGFEGLLCLLASQSFSP
jgi:FAD/FMN-containing dehydrogenase